jgi:hypothetical protein
MSPAKKNSQSATKQKISLRITGWFSGVTGKVLLCVLLIGIFTLLSYMAWQKIRTRVLGLPEYAVGPEQIQLTPPPPPWIFSTDLRVEVFNDLIRQGPLSIMDDDLNERVYAALLRQPWVAKVRQVSKYKGTVKVDLEYRRPVCMVETPGGLIPVDIEGTLLPFEDFSPIEKAKYPKLTDVERGPLGRVGTRWGDVRVVGGAEIANELLPLWTKLKLEKIVPRPSAVPASGTLNQSVAPIRPGDYHYEIIAHGGLRILWGHSGGDLSSGEPTPKQKIKKLEDFFNEHGQLDFPGRPSELDLRIL